MSNLKIRDRVRDLRRVKASDLIASAKNWRRHGARQRSVLGGVLDEIGFAGAVLARQHDDGRLELIDGHLRAETAGEAEIPVLVLDLNKQEADKLLAVYDPIGEMAEQDSQALAALGRQLEWEDAGLGRFLEDLTAQSAHSLEQQCGDPVEIQVQSVFQVVVECADETAQREAYDRLCQEGFRCRLLTLS